MASFQIGASVQNDGNFAHLDQFNPHTGIVKRIEVFRCSQPLGQFGITGAGTPVSALCEGDHLSSRSNRVHRSIYSEGQKGTRLPAIFEIREEFDPEGMPDGSWDVRIRDVDASSSTYGQTLHAAIAPDSEGNYITRYELRRESAAPTLVTSPLTEPISSSTGLSDLGSPPPLTKLTTDAVLSAEFALDRSTSSQAIDQSFSSLSALRANDDHSTWLRNTDSFLRFGDLGPKSIHPGTNLAGDEQELVSEYLVWRKYRMAMMVIARPFVPEMTRSTQRLTGPIRRGENDSKPGVYSLYVMAGVLGIQVYNLVLDKVYSDYGGIPMLVAPGSRMETGREPVADATRAIQTAANLAEAYFLRP